MKISPTETRIGWIGTGVMGCAMCGHLLEAGFPVTTYTRTKAKAQPLLDRGAKWADAPGDVAANSDVTLSIVGFPADVREVILGDKGVLAGASRGSVIVDMTTSQPALAEEIAAAAAEKDIVSLDAPVSGGDVGAQQGTLSIMIGGDADTVKALEPIWEAMGSKWVHQGGPGAGQHTKMVNQTTIASLMVGICEGLLYGYQAGLDFDTVFESVASGAAGSFLLSNLGPKINDNDFRPGFYVEHLIKDLGIALEESRRMDLKLPGLELAEQLYQKVAEMGHGRDGTNALILALAEMSDIEWQQRK